MEIIKNNFEILVEELKAKKQSNEADDVDALVFDGTDLNSVFEAIETSLEDYRFESEKKYNDSKMELANIFLSV